MDLYVGNRRRMLQISSGPGGYRAWRASAGVVVDVQVRLAVGRLAVRQDFTGVLRRDDPQAAVVLRRVDQPAFAGTGSAREGRMRCRNLDYTPRSPGLRYRRNP